MSMACLKQKKPLCSWSDSDFFAKSQVQCQLRFCKQSEPKNNLMGVADVFRAAYNNKPIHSLCIWSYYWYTRKERRRQSHFNVLSISSQFDWFMVHFCSSLQIKFIEEDWYCYENCWQLQITSPLCLKNMHKCTFLLSHLLNLLKIRNQIRNMHMYSKVPQEVIALVLSYRISQTIVLLIGKKANWLLIGRFCNNSCSFYIISTNKNLLFVRN